jgi:hypothetical protein
LGKLGTIEIWRDFDKNIVYFSDVTPIGLEFGQELEEFESEIQKNKIEAWDATIQAYQFHLNDIGKHA